MPRLRLAVLWSSLLLEPARANASLPDVAALIQQDAGRQRPHHSHSSAKREQEAARSRLTPGGARASAAPAEGGGAQARAAAAVQEFDRGVAAGTCGPLPRPLHYDYGKYADAYKYTTVEWTDAEFSHAEQLGRRGATEQLVPLMRKLQQGKTLRMVVMGGSSTAGANCHQGQPGSQIVAKECAWPRRFQHWLQQAFPQGKVELVNFAQGAATSSSILAGAPMMLQAYTSLKNGVASNGADIIFVDTLVNDVYQPQKVWGNQSIQTQWSNYMGSTNDTYSALAYEQLLRTLHQLQPEAVIYPVLSGCSICGMAHAHREVTSHYSMPQLDWGDFVKWKIGLWDASDVHPAYWYHASLADVLASVWGSVWRDGCPHPETGRQRSDWKESHFTSEQLEPFSPCLHPLSAYDAAVPSSTKHGITMEKGWKLYEDRPGKPGWISETPGTSMTFDLKFGAHPVMVVTWMRSYEKMGTATLRLNGKKYPIEGLWTEGLNENVSLAYTRWLQVDRPTLQPTADRELGVAGFAIQPYSNKTLKVEISPKEAASHKMKILQVFTC